MNTTAEALESALKYHRAGNLQQAEVLYRQLLQANPGHADALHFLGIIAHQLGQNEVALTYIKQSLEQKPYAEVFHSNLGMVYQSMGRFAEAASSYEQALEMQPQYVEAFNGLAIALADQGKLEEAVANYERALNLHPNYPEGHSNLCAALHRLGRYAEAETHGRKAVRLKPEFVEARNNLGNAQRAQGKLEEAAINFREAIRLRPHYPLALNNLGGTLQMQGKLDEAVSCYHQAVQIKPDYAEPYANWATVLQAQGRLDEAEMRLRQALRFQPNLVNALNNLGGVLQLQGNLDEALVCFRNALALAPNDTAAASNLLLCLNYDPKIDADTLLVEHRAWGERFGQIAGAGPAANHDRTPTRRLRVGYVSPDLSKHAITYFLQPILANHDPEQVETFCYAEGATRDATTALYQSLTKGWRVIHGLSDAQAAERIRADRIDVLVDLAGHTAHNRLTIFAHKPAPVQVTYLGYPCTTGLKTIDYCLTDARVDPPSEAAYFTEALNRLPNGFSCFTPSERAPEVGPLPASQSERLTFGSLHPLARLNAGVLDLWCELLRRVPEARLLVFRHTLQGRAQQELHRKLVERGIGPERFELHHQVEGEAGHFGVYQRVDIALDTFPWSGHTTACEALWMGVPVITLRGQRHAGRMVASVLTQAGLADFIAETPEHYLNLAEWWARDRVQLISLRGRLREQVKNSSLCNGKAFTSGLEAAYRDMWQRWCAGH